MRERIFITVVLVFAFGCRTAGPPLGVAPAVEVDIDRFVGQVLAVVPYVPGLGVAVVQDGRTLVRGYIYDRLLEKPDLTARYRSRLDELKHEIEEGKEQIRADLEKRGKRAPAMLRDPAAYLGNYVSPLLGTLQIRRVDGTFRARLGQLSGELEPFTEPDSARVELLPESGEVLRFQFSDSPRADAVKFRGFDFLRADPAP